MSKSAAMVNGGGGGMVNGNIATAALGGMVNGNIATAAL